MATELELELDGIVPPRQARSERTWSALMQAARELLVKAAWDDISVAQLCAHAGLTIGSFYGRFASRDAFFKALQMVSIKQRDAELQELAAALPGIWRKSGLKAVCDAIVKSQLNYARRDQGIHRASLLCVKHHDEDFFFKPHSLRSCELIGEQLAPMLDGVPREQALERYRWAHQVVSATVLHAMVVDRGPIGLNDRKMDRLLGNLMLSCLSPG